MPKLPAHPARAGGHPAHSGCSVPLRFAAAHLAVVLAAPALHGGLLACAAASAAPKAACEYPPGFDAGAADGGPAAAALIGKDLVYACRACQPADVFAKSERLLTLQAKRFYDNSRRVEVGFAEARLSCSSTPHSS